MPGNGMAVYGRVTAAGGDLIFFASFDPSRGLDYCNDRKRCGDGKCRRWLHIHHVAIYINGEYLIDSTGGDNSVQKGEHE